MTGPEAVEHLAALVGGCELIDLSPVIEPNMPRWPTHPDVEVIRDARTLHEHGYFAQTLVLPEHSGCHVDAPAHLGLGATVDELALDALIGTAKKIDVTGERLAPGAVLSYRRYQTLLAQAELTVAAGDIVLFEFGWDQHYAAETAATLARGWWGSNAPGLDEDICRSLYEAGIRAVGSDTAGCDIAVAGGQIVSAFGHREWFLPKAIPIIEGLQGVGKAPTTFLFLALPLRVGRGSGSPLRAVGLVPPASRPK